MSGSDPLSGNDAANNWRTLIRAMILNTVIYSILSIAVIAVSWAFLLPFLRGLLPGWELHWVANAICGVITVFCISPFLRSIVMKKNHSDEFRTLWATNRINRFPLVFTILVRIIIASSFVFYICNYLTRFTNALMITIALFAIMVMIMSRTLKHRSIKLERLFIMNLRSRDIAAQVRGKKRPLYEGYLLDRDIHISDFDVPEDSTWTGKKLSQLKFRNRFGVHVSSILRGSRRMNTPSGNDVVFPGDRIQVIGSDEQLANFGKALAEELYEDDPDIEQREMKLRRMVLTSKSPFIGKTLRESGIRDKYNCMVVGVEAGEQNLTMISPSRLFEQGDIIWVVGEEKSLQELFN